MIQTKLAEILDKTEYYTNNAMSGKIILRTFRLGEKMEDIIVKIVSDNEWEGKYQLLAQQREDDGLDLWSLGDNLPTGPKETVGGNSFFKTKLKELIKADLSVKEAGLKRQMELVFEKYPDEFADNYREAPEYVKRGAEFLRNSGLPVTAITGNREFDYQLLLDVVAEKLGVPRVDYMQELKSCDRFQLHKFPHITGVELTSVLFLPYHPEPAHFKHMFDGWNDYFDDQMDQLRDLKSERILIATHENPCSARFGSERAAKMQETLDDYIAGTRKINPNVTLFCGHLDISADPVEYNRIKVQPVSGTEAVLFNMYTGEYSKERVE